MPALPPTIRKAWVSGASSGLGKAFTQDLLRQGIEVWGTSRRSERLAEWRDQPGFHPVLLDLEQRTDAVQAFVNADEVAGGFDLVIHNAGYGVFGPFASAPAAIWSAQLEAMVLTLMELNRATLVSMLRRRRGVVVNVSSLATLFPLPFMAGYNVAKAALSALSESLMLEVASTGVIVIDFRPGDFRTDFNEAVRRGPEQTARLTRAWSALAKNLATAPEPTVAVRDLWRAVRRGRSATVTSGSFFQAQLAPLFARLAPAWLRRKVTRFYFGGV